MCRVVGSIKHDQGENTAGELRAATQVRTRPFTERRSVRVEVVGVDLRSGGVVPTRCLASVLLVKGRAPLLKSFSGDLWRLLSPACRPLTRDFSFQRGKAAARQLVYIRSLRMGFAQVSLHDVGTVPAVSDVSQRKGGLDTSGSSSPTPKQSMKTVVRRSVKLDLPLVLACVCANDGAPSAELFCTIEQSFGCRLRAAQDAMLS